MERGGRAASVYMMGCPAALIVWALEHTHVAEPGRPDGYLPYQRWVDFKMDGRFELSKLAPNLVSSVPRTYKLDEEDDDMATETSTESDSSSPNEDYTSNEFHESVPDHSDDLAHSSDTQRTPEILWRDLCCESSNKPKRPTIVDPQIRGRNLLQDLDNADDVCETHFNDQDISVDIQRNSVPECVENDRWWYYPCNEDKEVCLDFDCNDSPEDLNGSKSTQEPSFFSSCPGLSGFDIYGNPEHGGLQVDCSEDSRGNIFRRRSKPGYIFATLPSYPEERGPKMDTPFVVDADGFIMYVVGIPNLWSELESHAGDSMQMHVYDVEHPDTTLEIEGAISTNDRELEVLERDVPSRVQRIKKRREDQRSSRLERERIAELEAAIMKEEENDLKKYKNERKKIYSRLGFAKELQMIDKRRSTIEYQGRRCTREQVLHILESKIYAVELIDLYAEVILNKVVVDGKDRASYEILPADTFMRFKGYVGGNGDLENQFYREMMTDKVNDPQIDKKFCAHKPR